MKKNKVKKIVKKSKTINEILKENNQGIKLDIGCGTRKQDGFVGMDIRKAPGVDIVQNLERFPWSLPDKSVSVATASHVLEHINPMLPDPKIVALINLLKTKKILSDKEIKDYIGEYDHFGTFIRFMNEVWRILKTKGRFAFVVPYAGSPGFFQDPTHINAINEATLAYFDPLDLSGLWSIYKPYPWKVVQSSWNNGGNLEVILEKRLIDKNYQPDLETYEKK